MFPQTQADFASIEDQVQQYWKQHNILHKYLTRNKDQEPFSFIDGPITANNPMGVHHAWGRTLKDISQRYMTMKGYAGRYQNGFDCHGLWVEVEVEKQLGFASKADVYSYGMANFIEKCKERVEKYSKLQTLQSQRLGQWMDWDKSYFTHSDNNIEHIWYFLKVCNEQGLLYQGQRVLPWCPRCGTSLSQHEMVGNYKDVKHTAVYVAFELQDNSESYLVAWTTTPWTLPANTALAVNPNLRYVRVAIDDKLFVLAKDASMRLGLQGSIVEEIRGHDLVGKPYKCMFSHLEAQQGVVHRVVSWEEVGEDEGTGVVHIAPGCGAEDNALAEQYNLSVLAPLDENARFLDKYGMFSRVMVKEVNQQVISHLDSRGYLFKQEEYQHRYPTCWRCGTELVYRLVSEWFLRTDTIKTQLKEAARGVEWVPSYAGKHMQNWLDNMGDWCISRKRFWGLPLPFYRCDCGLTTVVGSKKELEQLATDSINMSLLELHSPYVDSVKLTCPQCGKPVSRVAEVGDCWLDAGIVPFSTVNYLSNKEQWERWFPADLVIEMREQIRLWFYAQLFMSVVLTGKSPYKKAIVYEKVHDKDGREMHKSWGNAIWFDDAIDNMGADVMRWVYAAHNIENPLNFGYYLADQARRKLLTLWNVYNFFVTYANADEWTPTRRHLQRPKTDELGMFDVWLVAKTEQLVLSVGELLQTHSTQQVTKEVETYLDDLSNWYVRCNRKLFWQSEWDTAKRNAYHSLYWALVEITKLLAPLLPHLTEQMYQTLVREFFSTEPESVHLCNFPAAEANPHYEQELLGMELARRVVALGHSARNLAEIRVRQPLEQVTVITESKTSEVLSRYESIVCDELNVKVIKFSRTPNNYVVYKAEPNYRSLGPKFGSKTSKVAQAIKECGHLADLNPTCLQLDVDGKDLIVTGDDFTVTTLMKPGYVMSEGDSLSVVLKTTISPLLKKEGWIRDFTRQLQVLRKDLGLDIGDRVSISYTATRQAQEYLADLSWKVAQEVLADELKCVGVYKPSDDQHCRLIKVDEEIVAVSMQRL